MGSTGKKGGGGSNGLMSLVGWGITTVLTKLIGKGSNSKDEADQPKPDTLSVSANETRLGECIPVVMGRALIKSPSVAYFGDFSAKPYTEEYAAHANFDAWPLVLSLISQYIMKLVTGHQVGDSTTAKSSTTPGIQNQISLTGTTSTVETSGGAGKAWVERDGTLITGEVSTNGATMKDDETGPLLNALFIWLLSWLINGRNLKTTIQKGFKYFLGYQFLLAWSGPSFTVKKVYMAGKQAWEGNVSRTELQGASGHILINEPDFFGGVDENGGFIGGMRFYLGGDAQMPDDWMTAQMSLPTVQESLRGLTPAYRPYATVVVPTAYIGKKATIPETWFEVQNIPNNLGLGAIGEDANPAECIYELLTNKDWGLAESSDSLDIESLVAMGQTLALEGLGISIHLTAITKAMTLVDDICNHIGAVHYADPHTGKMVFKLIRDDYKLSDCLLLNVSNCSNVEFTRMDWSQAISKISVTFLDGGGAYETASLSTYDPATQEINKGVQTVKSYDFGYFTVPECALWVAKRELQSQAYPLSSVQITGNRDLFDVRIGDVVVLDWAPYGIKSMPIRVTNIDIGDFVEGVCVIDGIEDIFGLGKTDYGFSEGTLWNEEEKFPTGVQQFEYMEMPYELVREHNTYVSALAVRPSENTEAWTVWRQTAGEEFTPTTTLSKWTPSALLVHDLSEFSYFSPTEDLVGFEIYEASGVEKIPVTAPSIAEARKGERLCLIGDEIIAYSSIRQLPNGNWQVEGIVRGTLDTVPETHYAMSRVYFLQAGHYQFVTGTGPVAQKGFSVTEHYNITTSTGSKQEEFDYGKVQAFSTKRRSEAPSPPGKVRVEAFGREKDSVHEEMAGDVKFSFVPRNKMMSYGAVSQEDETEYWSGAEFYALPGTDYATIITNGSQTLTLSHESSPLTIHWADICSYFNDIESPFTVKLHSRVDGLMSYYPQKRAFRWIVPTYMGIVADMEEAESLVAMWGLADRLNVDRGEYSAQFSVLYTRMPFFIVEDKTESGGTLLCHDGRKRGASKDIIAVWDIDDLRDMYMEAGFSFRQHFTVNGGMETYRWDGSKVALRQGG